MEKKGNPQDPHTYTSISIGSIIVLINIILTQFSSLYENQLLMIQFGFGKGYNDGIYVIKQL